MAESQQLVGLFLPRSDLVDSGGMLDIEIVLDAISFDLHNVFVFHVRVEILVRITGRTEPQFLV